MPPLRTAADNLRLARMHLHETSARTRDKRFECLRSSVDSTEQRRERDRASTADVSVGGSPPPVHRSQSRSAHGGHASTQLTGSLSPPVAAHSPDEDTPAQKPNRCNRRNRTPRTGESRRTTNECQVPPVRSRRAKLQTMRKRKRSVHKRKNRRVSHAPRSSRPDAQSGSSAGTTGQSEGLTDSPKSKGASAETRQLTSLAEDGDVDAQIKLARIFAEGRGVPADKAMAEQWCRRAAEQDSAEAQFLLGYWYDKGPVLERDYAQAVEWYQRAADQGHAGGQWGLGCMYCQGFGIPKDEVLGADWMRRSACQGYADAQCEMGWMYESGTGVPVNITESARWTRLAADQGQAVAQAGIASKYHHGEGVVKDVVEAKRWTRLAADQGNATAFLQLSHMYMDGDLCEVDFIEAHKCMNLAGKHTPEDNEKGRRDCDEALGLIEALMTHSQVVEARRRAKAWRPNRNTEDTAPPKGPRRQAPPA